MDDTMKYVTTYSGNRIYIGNPDSNAVLLTDIAHQLAMTCRFGGATKDFYSVAQHSSLGFYVARDMKLNLPTQVAILLHDGNEGPYPDIQRPIKEFLNGGWAVVEQPLEDVIYKKYLGDYIHDVDWVTLKKIDNVLCVYEGRALLNQADWTYDEKWKKHFDGLIVDFEGSIKDIDRQFTAYTPAEAKEEFMWNLRCIAEDMIKFDSEWSSIYDEVGTNF